MIEHFLALHSSLLHRQYHCLNLEASIYFPSQAILTLQTAHLRQSLSSAVDQRSKHTLTIMFIFLAETISYFPQRMGLMEQPLSCHPKVCQNIVLKLEHWAFKHALKGQGLMGENNTYSLNIRIHSLWLWMNLSCQSRYFDHESHQWASKSLCL